MPVPFRVGVMQLTMEPLDEMLASARAMESAGMDTIWLAEAYPWWRKHGMEARSSTVVSVLIARETSRLTIGWGIISPFTRHPIQVAMDARVVQEAAGPGRFPWQSPTPARRISGLSGSHMPLVKDVMTRLKDAGIDDVPVVVGGIIPPEDAEMLEQAGVAAVYTPKDFELNRIMSDLVEIVEEANSE